MNKRRLLILSSSLICVVLIAGGLWYWYSEQVAEQKLQGYIRKLSRMGCTAEERPLPDFRDDEILECTFWNDFSMEIDHLQVDHVYYDRRTHLLYFLRPYPVNGVKVEAFSYKWKMSDLLD